MKALIFLAIFLSLDQVQQARSTKLIMGTCFCGQTKKSKQELAIIKLKEAQTRILDIIRIKKTDILQIERQAKTKAQLGHHDKLVKQLLQSKIQHKKRLERAEIRLKLLLSYERKIAKAQKPYSQDIRNMIDQTLRTQGQLQINDHQKLLTEVNPENQVGSESEDEEIFLFSKRYSFMGENNSTKSPEKKFDKLRNTYFK